MEPQGSLSPVTLNVCRAEPRWIPLSPPLAAGWPGGPVGPHCPHHMPLLPVPRTHHWPAGGRLAGCAGLGCALSASGQGSSTPLACANACSCEGRAVYASGGAVHASHIASPHQFGTCKRDCCRIYQRIASLASNSRSSHPLQRRRELYRNRRPNGLPGHEAVPSPDVQVEGISTILSRLSGAIGT